MVECGTLLKKSNDKWFGISIYTSLTSSVNKSFTKFLWWNMKYLYYQILLLINFCSWTVGTEPVLV